MSYNINIIKVFRSIDDTKVMLIDTDYGKLILKVFSPKVKRNERFFKSLLKGDYYERLLSKLKSTKWRVKYPQWFLFVGWAKNLTIRPYLYHDYRVYWWCRVVWYTRYWWCTKNKIQQSINSLHQHGMVSGDPHRGNFIIKMVRLELLIFQENVLQHSVKRKIVLI